MMADRGNIPEAWPLLMTIDQVRAYLGGIDTRTMRKILPVQPLALGANVTRYSRREIDAWAATLRPKLPKAGESVNVNADQEQDAPAIDAMETAEDRRQAMLDRVRARVSTKAKRCQKTA